jgi:ribitol 2-dehydrogenase
MNPASRLKGKLAVVSGATSGIGQACVQALLSCDVAVIALGRDPAKLEQARSRYGPNLTTLCAELADPEARARTVEELGRLGRAPDIFVSNAAECVFESMLSFPAARLARLFEVNVTAAMELTQALVSRMQPGGHVVQISSVVARQLPAAKYGPYAATKAALDCLTEALRLELHPRGIRVSSVAPGLVDTPIYDKLPDFARTKAKIREQVPTWLSAEDVAEAILWILSRPAHVVCSELTLLPSAQAR